MLPVQSARLLDASQGIDVSSGTSLQARRNGRDTPELKEAFTDFVGQTFFGELIKQMRASVHKSDFFHGGMGEDIFQTQLDQVMVERISENSAQSFSDPMYQLFMAPRS